MGEKEEYGAGELQRGHAHLVTWLVRRGEDDTGGSMAKLAAWRVAMAMKAEAARGRGRARARGGGHVLRRAHNHGD